LKTNRETVIKNRRICLAVVIALCALPCAAHAAISIVNGSMNNLIYSGTGIEITPWPASLGWAPSYSTAMAAMAFPNVLDEATDEAGTLEATSANASVALANASASTAAGSWGISTQVTATSSGLSMSYAYAEAWQDMAIQVFTAQTVNVQADYSLSYDLTSSLNQEAYAYTEAGLLLWSALGDTDPLAETGDYLENWIFDAASATDSTAGTLSLDIFLDPGIYVVDMWLYATEAETASVPVPGALVLVLLGGGLTSRMRRFL
jgi:hypothetical protein